ncbi:MAG: 30S ribosomal protein S8 [bacterium]
MFSNFKKEVLDLLKRYNFIKDYEIIEEGNKKFIKINLKTVNNPDNDIPVIKFVSKPSRRWYTSYTNLKPVA